MRTRDAAAGLIAASIVLLAGCSSEPDQPGSGARADEQAVTLAVATVEPCQPGEQAKARGVEHAVKATLTVSNTGTKTVQVGTPYVSLDAEFNGSPIDMAMDTDGECHTELLTETPTLKPGEKYQFEVAYAVPRPDGELTIRAGADIDIELDGQV